MKCPRLVGVVIMHVDDFLGAGCLKSPRCHAVVAQLKPNLWKENQKVLEYCGCELEKLSEGGTCLYQTKCLEKVKPISLDKKRSPAELFEGA